MRGPDSSAGAPVSGSIHSEMPASASASATESVAWKVGSSRPSASAVASASVANGPYSVALLAVRQNTPFGRSMNWIRSSSGAVSASFFPRLAVFPCFMRAYDTPISPAEGSRRRARRRLLFRAARDDQEHAEHDRADARDHRHGHRLLLLHRDRKRPEPRGVRFL